MEVTEWVIDQLIRVSLDEMQFGFVSGKSTTDAIFPMRQVQAKYLAQNKHPCLVFDMEKTFDKVSCSLI